MTIMISWKSDPFSQKNSCQKFAHLINVLQVVLDLNDFVFIIGYIRGFQSVGGQGSVSWEVRSRAGNMTMSIDISVHRRTA